MHAARIIELDDGARLAILEDGPADAPVVTMTHSLATSSAMWEPQAEALADTYRVLRIDLRGHGASAPSPAPASFARLARDVAEIWDRLGIERSHYVGLSLGGIIGAELGVSHGERLAGLVLADCRFDATAGYLALWSKRRERMLAEGMSAIAEEILPTWITPATIAARPDLAAKLKAGVLQTPPEAWLAIVDLFPGLDLKDRLHQIDAATLFLSGSDDVVHDEMKACSRLVRGAAFGTVTDAMHLANLDQPEEFTRVLREFLNRATPSNG